MISAWWLIVIVPISVMVGYIACGLMSFNTKQEKCLNCKYNKEKSE